MSEPADFVAIETGKCMVCGINGCLWVGPEVAEAIIAWYKAGKPTAVQDEFPMLYAWEREMLISGIHPDCFDEAFGDDAS
jgi:hypothetical protein